MKAQIRAVMGDELCRHGGQRRRVVVTGTGTLNPLGLDVPTFWRSCVEGRSGIDWLTLEGRDELAVKIGGEVRGFDPRCFMDHKQARRMARFSQLAVAASAQAVAASGLNPAAEDKTRVGVLFGNVAGGYAETAGAVLSLASQGPGAIDPFYVAKTLPNLASGNVAMVFDFRGYNSTVTTACASGTQAIGEAAEVIRSGRADVMVAGGCEANITALGLSAFNAMRALSRWTGDPDRASRPFDAHRDGFVCSEGAAALVLESIDHARDRGAPILAELAGFATNCDAYHVVASRPDGDGPIRAMRDALADAGLRPPDVDYINAHATSTKLNDAVETLAIKAVFGEGAYGTPISATKSMLGHALGAAGAIESVACLKAIETGIIPPTINYEAADPECDLDYVPNQARKAGISVVLKNSFGFGGQNACLIFRRLP